MYDIVSDATNVYFNAGGALYYMALADLPPNGNVPIALASVPVNTPANLKYVAGALCFFFGGNAIYKLATP